MFDRSLIGCCCDPKLQAEHIFAYHRTQHNEHVWAWDRAQQEEAAKEDAGRLWDWEEAYY
jgi:hypothetical protein